jgi:hypothetical protein
MKYIRSADVGYVPSDFNISDKNDCAIRAVANVSSVPYPELRQRMINMGRKVNRGTQFDILDQVYRDAGAQLVYLWGKSGRRLRKLIKHNDIVNQSITLKRFVESMPRGKHIVLVRRHALAVVNGKIIDTFDNKANVRVIATFHFGE